ncbi:unnamed protein product, partial [Porites evermanni]
LADVGTEKDVIIEAPVKMYSHMGTQTEPLDFFIDCPVDLPLERQQRNVALDHTYNCKPKQVDAHLENVEPDSLQVDENLQLSDESAMEYCDVDDIGSVDGCDSSDEDWNPDKDDDSDDEKADFFNWLDKNK